MRLLGLTITRTKAQDLITRLPLPDRGWFSVIREPFTGAWQRSIGQPVRDPMIHPTYFACVTKIANDVAKIRPTLIAEQASGIWTETKSPAFSPVLRKPNHFQNRIQFYQAWKLSVLSWGNAYVLKERDARGLVTALYVLDPTRVQVLVGPSGDVYYQLSQDWLAGVETTSVTVPAREIIHDRMYELPNQPLIGMSPILAAGLPLVQAITLTQNAQRFAEKGSFLGGLLLAPERISVETKDRLEKYWRDNYGGAANTGAIAALGDNMKFEPLKPMSAVDSQVIELLRWDDEKICSAFQMPLYLIVGGQAPPYTSPETLNLQYYSQCLQFHFESLELALDEGLDLPDNYGIEFATDDLWRMDTATKMKVATDGVRGAVFSPNEARAMFNQPPVNGGETPYLQEQNWPISVLAKRPPPSPPAAPVAPSSSTPALPPGPQRPALLPSARSLEDDDALRAIAFRAKAAALGLTRGGAGSGNFGHEGRPGEVGGSAPGLSGGPPGPTSGPWQSLATALNLKPTTTGEEITGPGTRNSLSSIVSASRWTDETPGATSALRGMQAAIGETDTAMLEHVFIGAMNDEIHGQAITAHAQLTSKNRPNAVAILVNTIESPDAVLTRAIENKGAGVAGDEGVRVLEATGSRTQAIEAMYHSIMTHEVGHAVDYFRGRTTSALMAPNQVLANRVHEISVEQGHGSGSLADAEWRQHWVQTNLSPYAWGGGSQEAWGEAYLLHKLNRLPKELRAVVEEHSRAPAH